MFMFTFKFTLTFISMSLLKVIVTFYARKLKFGYVNYLDLNLQLCARVAPGSCPGQG